MLQWVLGFFYSRQVGAGNIELMSANTVSEMQQRCHLVCKSILSADINPACTV